MLNPVWRAAPLVALLACPALALGQRAAPAKATSLPGLPAASPAVSPAVVAPAAPATAPPAPPLPEAEEKTYTYVEIMPALPGNVKDRTAGASEHALSQELQRLLVVPAGTPGGVVLVEFTVQPTGSIKNAHIFRSLNPVADAAALQAIRQIPTLQPGMQNGHLVAVRYVLALPVPGSR